MCAPWGTCGEDNFQESDLSFCYAVAGIKLELLGLAECDCVCVVLFDGAGLFDLFWVLLVG